MLGKTHVQADIAENCLLDCRHCARIWGLKAAEADLTGEKRCTARATAILAPIVGGFNVGAASTISREIWT